MWQMLDLNKYYAVGMSERERRMRWIAACRLDSLSVTRWSSPSAYSGFVSISRTAEYFAACYTVLKRPNKVETAIHGCNLAFSLDSIVSLHR